MTAAEYRLIRKRMELQQDELAERLGISLHTVSRRELGQLPILKEAELALRWVEADEKRKRVRQKVTA